MSTLFSVFFDIYDQAIARLFSASASVSVSDVATTRDFFYTVSDGEVTITGVSFRDEPMLDAYSWWGWNLRTTGEDDNAVNLRYVASALYRYGVSAKAYFPQQQ